MHHTFDKKRHTINLFTYLAFIVMICSVGLILSGVVGYRYGITDLKTSLLVLTKYGVYGCILAIIFSFMAFGSVMRKDVNITSLFLILFTGIISAILIFNFYNYNMSLKSNPFINDISTDYTNNLEFNYHEKANDSYEKNKGSNQSLQSFGGFKQPYIYITPLLLEKNKDLVYEKSLEVINSMDLKIVFVDNKKGIIESTDTSFWYGFVDDFIVRVEALTSGVTKIDVRSASRKGKSDFGVNAERIKTFMALLKDSLG